ncbi:phage terminase small subunit P27 family [Gimesia maris]|uniref:phage terminase small subunit P27 family n=1 Tax=Gimesia maris TaxID=122 RepID=UPI0030DC0A02|tara:strand:+ start:2535 stop:2861 length:327 start_codon:yes stop_codon:yes gene_type:complete
MASNKAPTWLDTIGKRYWRSLSPLVEIKNESVREQLAQLCDHWSIFRECVKHIQKDGIKVINDLGTMKNHPCLATKWKAQAEINRLTKLLGLNEQAKQEVDELEEFLS